MQSLRGRINSCANQIQTEHEDVEIGRCIWHLTGIAFGFKFWFSFIFDILMNNFQTQISGCTSSYDIPKLYFYQNYDERKRKQNSMKNSFARETDYLIIIVFHHLSAWEKSCMTQTRTQLYNFNDDVACSL